MRAKIGDVIEMQTAVGKFYAQYTHEAPGKRGAVMRLFDKAFDERPDLAEVVKLPVRFTYLTPYKYALKLKLFERVGNQPVRSDLQPFPIFRGGNFDPGAGRITIWWLWDGVNEVRLDRPLTEEELHYPLQVYNSYPDLIEMIETGWTPATDKWN